MAGILPGVGSCGNCWCIPGNGTSCPEPILQTIFPDDHIQHLKEIKQIGARALNCNPFIAGSNCDTQPPLELGKAVCAAEIIVSDLVGTDPVCAEDFFYK